MPQFKTNPSRFVPTRTSNSVSNGTEGMLPVLVRLVLSGEPRKSSHTAKAVIPVAAANRQAEQNTRLSLLSEA
jgi:hypothetical protein